MVAANDDDDSSSASSGRSCGNESDSEDIFDDILMRDDANASAAFAAGPELQWTYLSHSSSSAKMFDGLKSRVLPSGGFELKYNHVDSILFTKVKDEVQHSLSQLRTKLQLRPEDGIDYVAAFAGAMPEDYMRKLFQWMKAAQLEPQSAADYDLASFADIIEFIRCEIALRLYGISSRELEFFGLSDDTIERYERVHDAMKAADMPAAKRHAMKVQRCSDTMVAAAGPAAESFDPIMSELVDALNKEWGKIFFVPGVSWIDVDDDKLAHSSHLFQAYGMKRTPTKDKKLKPVFHVAATTGSGNICHIRPDTIGLQLGEMLRTAILQLCPDAALRQTLALFLDRGYLDLAKRQEVKVTNLIQIINDLGAKFLGTVKNSEKFPFQLVDVNEDGNIVVNKRAKLQMYGHRSFWTARSTMGGTAIQASVGRHGGGRMRGGRILTSLPEAMSNAIVYETSSWSEMSRQAHKSPPPPLQEDATIDQVIAHAWKTFHASVYVISSSQRTADWFLGRLFRFTSTTFHIAVNVAAAEWYNTRELQELHLEILRIVQLRPQCTVTYDNVLDVVEEDLPSQRGNLHARVMSSHTTHKNTTPEFWLKNRTRPELRNACIEHGVDYPSYEERTTTRPVLADCLARHFQTLAVQREQSMGRRDIPDDDMESNKTAAVTLNRRMMPYWFPKPLQKSAGGAIDQGSANEELIVRVLRSFLHKLSGGRFVSREVKQFGLLANRSCQACSSSPDGVFPLLRRDNDGEGNFRTSFVSLCVLEIKTRSAIPATKELYLQTIRSGSWVECDSRTEEFRRAIPDNAYRSQVCQHAAALGLNYVLMVYSLPGALPLRMVLVHVAAEQRGTLVRMQTLLSTKYMPFAYVANAARDIYSLGQDYSDALGYAQEQHTVELFLKIWYSHNSDVMQHGTPTSCRRLIDMATSLWNKCMGNVDTIRRVVKTARAIRGRDSGPGSLMWSVILDYILYQAFRVHQHGCLEHKVGSFKSFKQFQREKKRNKSYRAFLYQLMSDLTPEEMSHYFPGLQAFIDHMQSDRITGSSSTTSSSDVQNHESPARGRRQMYKVLDEFLDPSSELYHKRLNKSLAHLPTTSKKKTESDGKDKESRRNRGYCIVCCKLCDEHPAKKKTEEPHNRRGRRTVTYCLVCKVHLCDYCFDSFHQSEHPSLPPCCSNSDRSSLSKRLRSSTSSIVAEGSPKRAVRKQPTKKQRTKSPLSPRGEITTRLQRKNNVAASDDSESSPQLSPSSRSHKRRRTMVILQRGGRTSPRRDRPTTRSHPSTEVSPSPSSIAPKGRKKKRHSSSTPHSPPPVKRSKSSSSFSSILSFKFWKKSP
ncbi:hypothetical protein ACHAWC_011246 [Mediolabrus comicus]